MTSFSRQLDKETLARVHAGRGRGIADSARQRFRVPTDPATGQLAFEARQLSAREAEVLLWVARGETNTEIGKRLFLSEETIKSHVRHILAKLGARSRAHAVALGIKTEQISLADL